MVHDKEQKLDERDKEEIEALLREIDLLLQHVILRIRERDSRIFRQQPKNGRKP